MLWTLQKIWYRAFQFILTSCMYLMPWRQPELLSGPGSIKQLPAFIKNKGVHNVLVVTDTVLRKLGLLDSFFAACDAAGLKGVVFDGVEPNPSIENIEAARKLYVEKKCDGIVAFGGGSAMDCAKAAGARVVKPRQSVAKMGGTLRVLKRIPPLFAVPTTAGTGSETTIAAVVTDRATHHKYAIQDLALIPRYAVLDPELTIGLPPHITSTTGMDALTHAVEAYTNLFAPKSTDKLAIKAVKLIFENLEKVYKDGTDITARYNMQLAAYYAGAAFTRACVGYVHGVAHTLGGLYGTPHGLANAVILPCVMEHFGPAVHFKLARLAEAVGINGKDDEEKAKAFIREIRRMNTDMRIQSSFDFIQEKDILQMIKWAMKEANPIYPVPVLWHEPEFRALIDCVCARSEQVNGSRYERQMLLPEIGFAGQATLAAASVLVVGCGGLGSTLLYDLCSMGIGRIGFCDGDIVSLNNLNRQFLHTPADIGRRKVQSAYEKLRAYAPELTLEPHDVLLTDDNALALVSRYDLVLLAVDSIASRLITNRACVKALKPLVDAGIHGLTGSVYTYLPGKTACLACFHTESIKKNSTAIPSFAPIVSAISSLEAQCAANILLGLPNPTDGRMLLFDGATMTTEFVTIARNQNCTVCS